MSTGSEDSKWRPISDAWFSVSRRADRKLRTLRFSVERYSRAGTDAWKSTTVLNAITDGVLRDLRTGYPRAWVQSQCALGKVRELVTEEEYTFPGDAPAGQRLQLTQISTNERGDFLWLRKVRYAASESFVSVERIRCLRVSQ